MVIWVLKRTRNTSWRHLLALLYSYGRWVWWNTPLAFIMLPLTIQTDSGSLSYSPYSTWDQFQFWRWNKYNFCANLFLLFWERGVSEMTNSMGRPGHLSITSQNGHEKRPPALCGWKWPMDSQVCPSVTAPNGDDENPDKHWQISSMGWTRAYQNYYLLEQILSCLR